MRLTHTHHLGGPGRVAVDSPELAVRITVDPDAEYRSVDILADRGLAAWAGPTGTAGIELGIKVGRPTLMGTLAGKLGIRQGSYVSGGGSATSSGSGGHTVVRATGRGSIAAGGNIQNVATGDGARVSGFEKEDLPPVGVNITAPLYCTFRIKSAAGVTVLYGGREMTLYVAQIEGLLGVRS